MILELVVDILTVEFCVDMSQDNTLSINVFIDHWIILCLWFCFKMENKREHKLEHGTNQL